MRLIQDPVPVIEYKDLLHAQKSEFTGRDTAVLSLGYEDGDGDIFMDNNTQGPNVIFIPFFYNTATGKFDVDKDPITQDTFRITNTIVQPDNGYYKGKSIKGEIFIPLREFRINDAQKIIKFTGFVIDLKGHRSNSVASPVYTLNF
ncbi:hypothetical protein CNR22_16185 [Sphingobacteriaceae bacterium]|nr:hypothetical protein CNR22_16185 [Sphingobacteriaceae bacterium]